MKMYGGKKRIWPYILSGALLLLAAGLYITLRLISGGLVSQYHAGRWQGESEQSFSQISCYLPEDGKIALSDISAFRSAMQTKLHEAALDIADDNQLITDAWSTGGKVQASTALGKGEVTVTAVGGDYFQFHPITLMSGSYIAQSDLMKDRVLLDEDTAWLLFGGVELQGMSLTLDGKKFVVAGVIEREQDFASKKAYSAGMGIYMSYEGYQSLNENAGISCYELVMAEPVSGFALQSVEDKFPIGTGEIVQNTGRFGFFKLLKIASQLGLRAMHTSGVLYPYWENAARYVEQIGAMLAVGVALCLAFPAVFAAVLLVRYIKAGKRRLDGDVIPKLKDSAEEAIRVRARRRWEKKHGLHERE